MYTRARHRSPYWDRWIKSTTSHAISCRFILIVSSHPHLSSSISPLGFITKTLNVSLLFLQRATCCTHNNYAYPYFMKKLIYRYLTSACLNPITYWHTLRKLGKNVLPLQATPPSRFLILSSLIPMRLACECLWEGHLNNLTQAIMFSAVMYLQKQGIRLIFVCNIS